MARIFISYKRADKDKVFKIKDQIESALGEECWVDLDGIDGDAVFTERIMTAIESCEVFLFMYSSRHTKIVDYQTDWTIRELQYAESEKKRIVFINLDGTKLTNWFRFIFGTKQQVDGKSADALKKLYEDIGRWLSVAAPRDVPMPTVIQHPVVRGCAWFQIALYVFFTIISIWLLQYDPIPYTQRTRIINAVVMLSFMLASYFTYLIFKLKRWAFWGIFVLDVVVVILMSWISTNMTGKVLDNEFFRQLHGYGRALNFGQGVSGFIYCLILLSVAALHSFATYLILQIKYMGRSTWDLMR